MRTISVRQRRVLVPADGLEMHDSNAAVVAIFGARRHNAHRPPVPLDRLPHLQLVVESGHGAFGGVAVDVNDVVERVCHNRLG
jgi:hypothetical protein